MNGKQKICISAKVILLFSLFIFHFSFLSAQKVMVDSLLNVLKTAKDDSAKISLLNEISFKYWDINPGEGLNYANEALQLAEQLQSKRGIAEAYSNISRSYRRLTNITKSLEYGFKSLKMYEEIGDKPGIAENLVTIGNTYRVQKDYDKSLEYLTRALKMNEESGDKIWIARNLNGMGNLYKDEKKYDKAEECYSRSLKAGEELGNKERISAATINLGGLYGLMKEYSKALEKVTKGLNMAKELGEGVGISECYLDFAAVYRGLADMQNQKVIINTRTELLRKAKLYCDSAIDMDRGIHHFEGLQLDYGELTEILIQQDDYKNAFDSYKFLMSLNDSISNEESGLKISQLEKNNEEDLKQKEIEIQKLQLQSAKKEQVYFICGLAIVILFSGFIFRSLNITRKQKKSIETKNKETEEQKKIIEDKNKDILDSINYAKRLQDAILPPINLIKQTFPESFVLYKPKDIVAGDFYWMERVGDMILIAAADCTGHGVPGALVSVVCSNALNRAVKEFGITDPGKILDKTRDLLLETFEKSENNVQDGMDISLCSFEMLKQVQHGSHSELVSESQIKVSWSGAYNSLWYIQNKEMKEIDGDKQPIGKHDKLLPFKTHNLNIQKGDTLYLFTDGYADQFGGTKGKKFKYKQLQQLLMVNRQLSMEEQKEQLAQEFENWKGALEQVDDVLVIGIRA